MLLNKCERKKRLLIMLWIIISAFILWMMNMVKMQSFDLGSFLWFAIFLLGSGVAYHFLIEMIKTPINSENDSSWNSLIKYALLSALTVFFVILIGLFEKYIYSFGGSITMLSIFIAIWFVCGFTDKAIKAFLQIEKGA